MQNEIEKKSFVNSGFLTLGFAVIFTAVILAIYFLVPSDNSKDSEIALKPVSIDTEEILDEEDTRFQDYFMDVSFEQIIDKSKDNGLSLYRQDFTRNSVEWFYFQITGNRDVTLAILNEADKNDIPLSLAFALAYTESRYNVKAVNKNSNNTIDRGLFQLNSNSFPKLTEADFFDPFISAKYGMSHLKFCISTAGNEVSALAMYNAGTTKVKSNRTPQVTLNYIGKIMSYQKTLENLFTEEVVSYYETHLTPGIEVAYSSDKRNSNLE